MSCNNCNSDYFLDEIDIIIKGAFRHSVEGCIDKEDGYKYRASLNEIADLIKRKRIEDCDLNLS